MKHKRIYLCWVFIVVCSVNSQRLFAQDTAMAAMQDTALGKSKWHFLLEPYVMFPNMHGTTGLGGLPNAQVDENPGDIFKKSSIRGYVIC